MALVGQLRALHSDVVLRKLQEELIGTLVQMIHWDRDVAMGQKETSTNRRFCCIFPFANMAFSIPFFDPQPDVGDL